MYQIKICITKNLSHYTLIVNQIMTDRMNILQLPSSQEGIQQMSQSKAKQYKQKERLSRNSKLGSEPASLQNKKNLHDEINLNNDNSPDSSIQFLGKKRRAGCQTEKYIENPLRKILHSKDRCTSQSIQVKPQQNDKKSDESGSLTQSFFANLLEKSNEFYSKITDETQNRGQIESKVRNIEDLFDDIFLMEIQKNPISTLMQKGRKERDRSYEQSQSQQVSMGIRLNNEKSKPIQSFGQNISPNYPQIEEDQFKQYIPQSTNRPLRDLRSNQKAIKKHDKYEKRMKNILKANQTQEIQEINSENEIQVTNLKSLEISTNMVRKQNQHVFILNNQNSSNDEIADEVPKAKINLKAKNIKSNQSSQILSNRDEQLFEDFLEVIRITKDRNMPNEEKEYRWKLGTVTIWRNINTALQINFSTFLRQSKKYQKIFKKYIPRQLHFKIEPDQYRKKEEAEKISEIPQTKLQSMRERKKKQQLKNLVKLRQLFNKAQLAKLIDYQRMIDEKGRTEVLFELAQSQYSDYQPESAVLENMIEEIVVETNSKQRKGSKIQSKDAQRGQILSQNQSVLFNLTKASRNLNYIRNMANIFYFYHRAPTLSCLGSGSLGLRSSNCKIIDQSTFLHELKLIQLRESKATIPENSSMDLIKYERSSALFTAN